MAVLSNFIVRAAHLALTALHVQAPEVDAGDSKLGKDVVQGHARDDCERVDVNALVPLVPEAVAHELKDAARRCPMIHEVHVLVRLAGSHMHTNVVLAVGDHLCILRKPGTPDQPADLRSCVMATAMASLRKPSGFLAFKSRLGTDAVAFETSVPVVHFEIL